MSNMVDSKAVTTSIKLYDRLLMTYPAAFRAKFGPEMKQVFHDQCRDAWSRGKGRSLAWLWLLVLPDWAKTSLVQHLLVLHRRESPSRKIIRSLLVDPGQQAVFIRVFAPAWGMAFVCSVLAVIWSPKVYVSATKLIVDAKLVDPTVTPDPYLLPIQIKLLESPRILTNVIGLLHLDRKLAQQSGSNRWSIGETYDYLVNTKAISVHEVPGSNGVIEIAVRNMDPNLAADIANTLAPSLEQFQMESWREAKARGFRNLEQAAVSKPEVKKLIKPLLLSDAPPKPISMVIANPAQPDLKSFLSAQRKIFFMWILGGTLLAAVAGGGSACLAGQGKPQRPA
jgi:hypothetical protein